MPRDGSSGPPRGRTGERGEAGGREPLTVPEETSAPVPARPGGIIGAVIALSARHGWAVLLAVGALAAWGWFAAQRAPLDAIPDLSEAQVIVFTDWPGHSPDQVENQVTYPISAALLGAPRVRVVRGQSMFAMSFVYVIFEDGTDLYWARSRLLEYLDQARGTLPAGVQPRLGPDATAVGWVLEYALIDRQGKHDLQQLRALQDWNLRYALESVHGVAEVAAVGGFVKQYQVEVDPRKLRSYGIPLAEVLQAVRRANDEVGGSAIELGGHEVVIRGRSYVRAPADLASVPLAAATGGAPVTLRDVAAITLGPAERRGLAELGGRGEAVGGIVVMRFGENALATLRAVKERLAEIAASLPPGVEVVVTYDRSRLIEETIATLRRTLGEEMVVVSLVIFIFLLHARSALVPILSLPIAVLLSFIPMLYQGLTINLMSLGGIAVALGAMVDATIILVENAHKRLEAWEAAGRPGGPAGRAAWLVAAMQEVGPNLFFSLLVITAAFLPVLTLQGTEGRLFAPLAFSKTYAMGFSALLAVTLTPALAALLLRGPLRREAANPLNRWLIRAYSPVVRLMVDHRKSVVAAAVLLAAVSLPAWQRLGQEFMPPLNEGVILYMPTAPPGMSIATASRILEDMDRQLAAFPEVATVFGKMGRAETATDPAPLGMVETVVALKPRGQWRRGLTWDGLIREMDARLRYPGMPNVWWMPIQTRTEMLATGLRSPLGVKVLGDDLAAVERTAIAVERAIGGVDGVAGTRSALAERAEGGLYLDIDVDREAASRYGLRVADVYDVVAAAVGGEAVGQTLEGRQRYPVVVRYAREFRDDPQTLLSETFIQTPAGLPPAGVPLSQVARVHFTAGPPMLRSEEGKLVGYVFLDVAGRPLAEYVADAKRAVAARVRLAPGTRIEWAGQYESYQRARRRLALIVPLTLLLIVVLLYAGTGSFVETGMVLLAVPFSLIGAVWLLYLLDYNVSVAVWVGLIALAGLDAETGVVMLLYLKLAWRRRLAEGRLASFADLREAIVEGAAQRIRPKLMTVLTMTAGLLPLLWSSGTGADLMKRIAAPMAGGLATSFLLELLVYPALFALWRGRVFRAGRALE
jgi:Cu(I)/Ag(I) efflux system membrane protein CusA/SilA